jgi:hypothetical protein
VVAGPAIVAEPTPNERSAWAAELTSKEQEDHGMRPVTEGGVLYCGVTEQEYAIGGVTYAWPIAIKKLRWSLNFSRLGQLSDMDFKDAATTWFKEIADCCDRQFEYTSNTRLANILYTVQRLDGKSGVLADMRLPVGNVNDETQLIGRFDDAEGYTLSATPGQGEIGLYPVGLHETEHAMGLGHQPANIQKIALIQPVYNPLVRNLQAADIAELQRRYGPPQTVVPPPPTPPVKGSTFTFTRGAETFQLLVDYPSEQTVAVKIDITKGEKKATLSGSKPW